MNLEQLTEQGFASLSELDSANGIAERKDLGINEFGLRERQIIDTNGKLWELIPEDGLYELARQ